LLALVEKGLSGAIGVSYARPRRTPEGWVFDADGPYSDGLKGVSALHEVYSMDVAPYTGRITVPLLWDRVSDRAVSNESADIVRMLNDAFGDAFGGPDLAPADLRDEIDAWNARIYRDVNNGVYRAGFARTQEAYDTAVAEVFAALDEIEAHLRRPGLAVRGPVYRGRPAPVPDAGAVRRGLSLRLQVQHPATDRLPEALGLRAAHLPPARRGGDGTLRHLQAGLFLPLGVAKSAWDRAGGSRDRLEVEQRRSGRGLRPVGA
jgi:glutathione S-transferase